MKPGIPWSIKGIESETREAAKAAARRSGMTLGQWLNGMIQDDAELQHLPSGTPSGTDKKPAKKRKNKKNKSKSAKKTPKIDSQFAELAEQLNALSDKGQATAVNRFVEYDNEPVAQRALEAMIERIERGEFQSIESFQAVNTRLDTIDDKLTGSALTGTVEETRDQSPEFQALESALRNIVDHIETSEKRNRDSLGTMQERMSEMSKKVEGAQSGAVSNTAPAIAALDARIAELALKNEQAASSSQQETRSFLEERLAGIGEQIDAVRHSTDAMTKRAEASAADIAKKQTRQVEERVAGLIGEARSLMVKSAPSGETLNTIRGEIESLNQRFDDIKAESASDQDVQSLKLAIEQLTSNVTTSVDGQPVADFEQRLGELTRRLDEKPVTEHMAPQFADLEQRIVGLDQKLAVAVEQQGDSAAFAALEAQISMVGDRMSATEEKLGTLATIEQSIAQLYSAVEDGKAEVQTIASAATQTADGVVQQGFLQRADTGASPELIALEEGLAAVRQSSQAAEQHNQETLEAVHETLEQIITKLADMEGRGATAPAAVQPGAPAQSEQPAVPPQNPAGNDWQSTVQSHLQETEVPPQTSYQSDFGPAADVSAEFDPGPLPDMTTPQTPTVEVSDQPETAPEADHAPLDYIAQARLASQSASTQSSSPVSNGAGFFTDKITGKIMSARKDPGKDGELKKTKSLFSLPFLTKKKIKSDNDQPEKDQQEVNPALGGDSKSSRKRLIMAGLMLLIAAGAFVYSKAGGNSNAGLAPTASVQEKVITPQPRPSYTPVPQNSSQSAGQALQAKKLVEQISLTIPQNNYANPFGIAATVNQTGMPPARALANSNRGFDPVKAAPIDPVTTASLSRAPGLERNIQSPLNIQTAARPAPAKSETDQSLPPTAIGTSELRQAAVGGNASAQFVIATRFADGKRLARDYAKAAEWYQKAAANGLAPAQYRLGTLFERGNGVPKDLNAARLWYERAAEKGNVKAMHNLAVIYAGAAGGKTDYAKARKWFEKAAGFGLKDSQYNLAVIYDRGLAGARNQQEAFYWYSQAAAQGDRGAGLKTRTLKNYLSAAELKSTEKRLASWRPQPAEKPGNFVAIKDPKWQVGAKVPAKSQLGVKPTLSGKVLVKRTQTLLTKLGFDVGGADGIMGSRTANAVRLFQLQNGLQVNGMVTNDLLQQIQART